MADVTNFGSGQGTKGDTGVRQVTIAVSTKVASFPTGGARKGSFKIPSAFTGATVTINGSLNNSNWTAVLAEGNEANPITVAANGSYAFPDKSFNFPYIQISSASNEAAARTLDIFLRG